MIWFKYYKQIHHLQKYFSCRSTLGRYIHCIYRIEPNLNFSVSSPQEILQILQVLPSSSSSLLSSFNDSAKSLHCHIGLVAAPPEVNLHWKPCLMVSSLLIPYLMVSSFLIWWYLLFLFREIWSLSDCNWTRTHNHLVRKQHSMVVSCGFEFSCCQLEQ